MSQYTFPCIITDLNKAYSATFPDLDNRTVFGTTLYNVLKSAANVLMVELYAQELQRIRITKPASVEKIQLNDKQFISYVICDTEVLENIMELYDNVQTDDLVEFLRNQDKKLESEIGVTDINKAVNKVTSNTEATTSEEQKAEQPSDTSEESFTYEDDLVVRDPSAENEHDNKKSINPKAQNPQRRYSKTRPKK